MTFSCNEAADNLCQSCIERGRGGRRLWESNFYFWCSLMKEEKEEKKNSDNVRAFLELCFCSASFIKLIHSVKPLCSYSVAAAPALCSFLVRLLCSSKVTERSKCSTRLLRLFYYLYLIGNDSRGYRTSFAHNKVMAAQLKSRVVRRLNFCLMMLTVKKLV